MFNSNWGEKILMKICIEYVLILEPNSVMYVFISDYMLSIHKSTSFISKNWSTQYVGVFQQSFFHNSSLTSVTAVNSWPAASDSLMK